MKVIELGRRPVEWAAQQLESDSVVSRADAARVQSILDAVQKSGDKAIGEWSKKLDGIRLRPAEIEVPRAKWGRAAAKLESKTRRALNVAAERIREFHLKGVPVNAIWKDGDSHFGKMFVPLRRVGIYVPGGKNGYPSTVLMTAVPAKVAGVPEIVVVTPPRKGGPSPAVLAACEVAGVDRLFQVGGPMAIAALTYGTETIPRVDKIVGPGNAFVTLAKRLVYGSVGIDMPAGPTELVVIADDSVNAEWIAADLAAQAEHGPGSRAVLVTASRSLADGVARALGKERKLKTMDTQARERCAAVMVSHGQAAADLTNRLAPEHVHIQLREAGATVQSIHTAGAVFVGPLSPVALGDYVAGPSHVLPTGGSARFSSPLGVEDFLRRMNLISVQEADFDRLARSAAELADAEGFVYHAYSVVKRVKDRKKSRISQTGS